jgi:hypothetical protein
MGARGDRQELGQALHEPEDDGFDPPHGQRPDRSAGDRSGCPDDDCTQAP